MILIQIEIIKINLYVPFKNKHNITNISPCQQIFFENVVFNGYTASHYTDTTIYIMWISQLYHPLFSVFILLFVYF